MIYLKVYRTVINSRHIVNKEILCWDSILLENIQTKAQ